MKKKKILKAVAIICSLAILGGGAFAIYKYRDEIREFFTQESTSENTKCMVTFEIDGELQAESQIVNNGEFATVPNSPYKEDYKFLGWAVNGEIVDLTSYPITSDTHFVAVFEERIIIADWKFGANTLGLYMGNESEIDNIPTSYDRLDKVVEVYELESIYDVLEKISFNGSNFEDIYKSFYLTASNLPRTFFEDYSVLAEHCQTHGDPEGPITLELCDTKFYQGEDYDVINLGMYSFANSTVEKIVLPKEIVKLNYTSFVGATNLKEIIIQSEVKVMVEGSESLKIPSDCKIYVRDDLINLYTFDDLWPVDQTYKISEYDDSEEETKSFEVKFVADEEELEKQEIEEGAFATVPTTPTKEGYTFKGWAVNGEIVDLTSYPITQDTTFTAVFEIIPAHEELITDFTFDGTTLTKYIGTATDVTIPSSYSLNDDGQVIVGYDIQLTAIGDQAFFNSKVEKVVIPEGVTSIGGNCFTSSTSLVEVQLPQSLTTLSYSSFFSCSALTTITIPEGITKLPNSCFANCTSLESIVIPASVTTIESNCFKQCQALMSITLPSSVVCAIQNNAFNMVDTNIFVPADLLEGYKSTYPTLTDRFFVIE